MSIPNEPYYELPSSELADWIEKQGEDVWWNVDGDPLLMGRLLLPCPGDELAEELRKINKPIFILVGKKDADAKGKEINKEQLDDFVGRLRENVHIIRPAEPEPPWLNDRILFLRWKDAREDWLLSEDLETTESSRRDAATGTKEDR